MKERKREKKKPRRKARYARRNFSFGWTLVTASTIHTWTKFHYNVFARFQNTNEIKPGTLYGWPRRPLANQQEELDKKENKTSACRGEYANESGSLL